MKAAYSSRSTHVIKPHTAPLFSSSATGIFTLSGTATIADYEAAIAGLRYDNTSGDPNINLRNVTVSVFDGNNNSNTGITRISVQGVNEAPLLDLDADDSSDPTFQDGYNTILGSRCRATTRRPGSSP